MSALAPPIALAAPCWDLSHNGRHLYLLNATTGFWSAKEVGYRDCDYFEADVTRCTLFKWVHALPAELCCGCHEAS